MTLRVASYRCPWRSHWAWTPSAVQLTQPPLVTSLRVWDTGKAEYFHDLECCMPQMHREKRVVLACLLSQRRKRHPVDFLRARFGELSLPLLGESLAKQHVAAPLRPKAIHRLPPGWWCVAFFRHQHGVRHQSEFAYQDVTRSNDNPSRLAILGQAIKLSRTAQRDADTPRQVFVAVA